VELHRWLEDAEKERRGTMMDRKTLTRVLQKLQREGRCKCILLSMPGLTNCGRSRVSEVVLLPSVEIVPELLTALHDRIRNFEMNIRGQGSIKVKSDVVPVLSGVTRMSSSRGMTRGSGSTVEMEAEKACSLQENGFIPAKMVRVRMLHYFLWSYISDILDGGNSEHSAAPNGGHDDLNINASSCKVFVLSAALKVCSITQCMAVCYIKCTCFSFCFWSMWDDQKKLNLHWNTRCLRVRSLGASLRCQQCAVCRFDYIRAMELLLCVGDAIGAFSASDRFNKEDREPGFILSTGAAPV